MPASNSVASVVATLRIDTAAARQQLGRDLADTGKSAGKQAGDQAGKAFRVDTRAASKALASDLTSSGKSAGKKAGQEAGKSFKESFSEKAKELSKELVPAFAAAVSIEGAKKFIEGANELNIAMSANAQIFGKSNDQVEAWSKTTATAFGLARSDALEATKSFGGFLTSVGLTTQSAAGLSEGLVKVAANLGAFDGSGTAEALDAIQGALRGEYDSLQRYIPTISSASIQTQALATSGKKTAASLTDQDKALALNQLLLKSTANQVGAVHLQQGNLGLEIQKTTAQIKDQANQLGQSLLPGLTSAVKLFNEIGPSTILAGAGIALLANRFQASKSAADKAGEATGLVGKALNSFKTNLDAAQASGSKFAGVMAATKTATGGLKSAASGVMGLLGGPWGIILTGATLAVGFFVNQQQKAAAAAKEARQQVKDQADGLKEYIDKQDEASKAALRSKLVQDGLDKSAKQAGVSFDEYANSLSAGGPARDKYLASLQAQSDAYKNQAASLEALGNTKTGTEAQDLYAQSKAAGDHSVALNKLIDTTKEATKEQEEFYKATGQNNLPLASKDAEDYANQLAITAKSTGQSTDEANAFRISLQHLSPEQQLLATNLRKISDVTLTATDRAKALKDAYDEMFGSVQQLDGANESYEASIDSLSDSIKNNGKTLDVHTEKGRANRDSVISVLKAVESESEAELASGATLQDVTKNHNDRIAALKIEAKNLGLNATDTQALIDKYGQMPSTAVTNVSAPGLADTIQAMIDADLVQQALKAGVPADTATIEGYLNFKHAAPGSVARTKAGGGLVDAVGSPTEDNIPVRLSAREYVIRAASVDKIGLKALNQLNAEGRISPSGLGGDGSEGVEFMGKYAGGGSVKWPVVIPVSAKIPTTAEQVTAWVKTHPGSDSSFGLTSHISLDLVNKTKDFIKAQAGKPYIWDSAGPGGYDCSGIVSAAYNMLNGSSPYSHTFGTEALPGNFLSSGTGTLTVGYAHPGQAGGSASVGHTAANLLGLGFESTGSTGVRVGSSATDPRRFANIGHAFDSGGVWPHNTVGHNTSGHDEYVATTKDSLQNVELGDRSLKKLAQVQATQPVQLVARGEVIGDLALEAYANSLPNFGVR